MPQHKYSGAVPFLISYDFFFTLRHFHERKISRALLPILSYSLLFCLTSGLSCACLSLVLFLSFGCASPYCFRSLVLNKVLKVWVKLWEKENKMLVQQWIKYGAAEWISGFTKSYFPVPLCTHVHIGIQAHISVLYWVRVLVICFLNYTKLYKLLTHGFGACQLFEMLAL